ncbi:predicted protein [Plenodomus lingam JN3]|uniref:Predicted protein n=1 Tax=Leptosphaeria maculans (strain JN3 / isolate v23.1.3 / race Av1-4-5-6-7-8) TaxID=985895 RepID=E5A801_LEPMJ|nr:predicted protein [Plenodomus lingam JN3]CBX99746.1 predicted protein [Plenodomus lingam JN3]
MHNEACGDIVALPTVDMLWSLAGPRPRPRPILYRHESKIYAFSGQKVQVNKRTHRVVRSSLIRYTHHPHIATPSLGPLVCAFHDHAYVRQASDRRSMKAESGQRVAANSQFIKTVDNVWCAEDCLVRSWIYSYCSYPYVVGIERDYVIFTRRAQRL